MWTELRKEIERIRKVASIPESSFKPVNIDQWKSIEEKVFKSFCQIKQTNDRPAWLWEVLKSETYSIQLDKWILDVYLYKLIDHQEKVWLMLNETVREKDKFRIYEGYLKDITYVLAELVSMDEIYLVSKKYHWILCVNNHDYLIGGGEMAINMKRLIQE
jgi:hypothetical protein